MKRSPALKAAQDKYLGGKPNPITFRLDGLPRDKLRGLRQGDESDNQTAKRLLLQMLDEI